MFCPVGIFTQIVTQLQVQTLEIKGALSATLIMCVGVKRIFKSSERNFSVLGKRINISFFLSFFSMDAENMRL